MTKKIIIFEFLKKTVLPLAAALILFFIAKELCTAGNETDYFVMALICGFPFGIHFMSAWLIPHNMDLAATVGIFFLNLIIAGIIGCFVLGYRIIVALVYIPITIIHLAQLGKNTDDTIQQ